MRERLLLEDDHVLAAQFTAEGVKFTAELEHVLAAQFTAEGVNAAVNQILHVVYQTQKILPQYGVCRCPTPTLRDSWRTWYPVPTLRDNRRTQITNVFQLQLQALFHACLTQ